ncbi:MAG: DotU family type IV/VI secretion system protein [Deltaproteobacteria bacterium]|nr:DotU family type IV/VI secretion system protein [Deltaproteobacteria bacterium]
MHLTDCFMPVIAYVVYFLKTAAVKQPPYDQVKADIFRLLGQSEDCLKKGLFSQEDYDGARFAICSWIDEAILNSSWNQKQQWQREQLQRLYYQTTEAGEEFFERLNALGPHQRDVREIYYLCLALGFAGRFCQAGDEALLEQLKTSNLKLLAGSSVGIPSLERTELFPEAYPAETVGISPPKQRFPFSLLTAATLVAPVILFGALFMIYRFVLKGVGENFLFRVP